MTALRKLHLYGDFARRFGAEHEVAAGTISEAIRIVDCNEPGFALAMRRRNFHVAVGDGRIVYDNDNGIERGDSKVREVLPHQLAVPTSKGDLHLIPAFTGAKSRTMKTIFSVVVGGALLATGIGGALAAGGAAGGAGGLALGASTGFLGLTYGTVALMGASLFLGGISMLLAPSPQTDTSERKPTAFGFDGPGEVDDEGGPIHIIIGEVLAPPIRIASSITTASQANNDSRDGTKWGGSGGGGGGGGGGSGGAGEWRTFIQIN